jgi:DNA-binding PadR family transcriptional regulator
VAARQLPTPTGYALLGLLSFGSELTGYELKQWADGSLRFFYNAPAMSQIYTELGRMQGAGLVLARDHEDGARTVRRYRLSARGRRELRRWLDATPLEPPLLKHHLALRLFLGHLSDPGRLGELVDQQCRWCDEQLADLRAVRVGLDDDPDDRWGYARLVADWGLEYYSAERRSLQRLAGRLATLGGGPSDLTRAGRRGEHSSSSDR